jgi:hypothetical protein
LLRHMEPASHQASSYSGQPVNAASCTGAQ